MKKDISLKIKVQLENANTIKELEDALENINTELEEVDENSKAFQDLTSFADKATQEIDQLNDKVRDLNGQSQKIDDGMKGLSGSTELYTNANKELSSSLKDVTENGGAIAVLDSLTGGLASRFRDTLEASKLFNLSLKGMRTALIATGIGAFIVALGLVVAYWDRIKDAVRGTVQQLHNKLEAIEKTQERLNHEVSLLEKQKTLYELQGRLTGNIVAEHKKKLLLLQEENKEELKTLEALLAKEILRAKEVTLIERLRIIGSGLVNTQAQLGEKIRATLPVSQEILDIQEKIRDAKSEEVDIDIALATIEKEKRDAAIQSTKDAEEARKAIGDDTGLIDPYDDVTDAEEPEIDDGDFYDKIEAEIAKQNAKADALHKQRVEQDDLDAKYDAGIKEDEIAAEKLHQAELDRIGDQKLQREAEARQARVELAMGLYNDLKALSQTFFADTEEGQKKMFEFNKAISLAETIVSTIVSTQAAFRQGMALGLPSAFLAAGLAAAAGLARVAAIQRTQFNSTSIDASPGGGGQLTTPQRIQPNVPILDLESGEQKIKVIVTETDIREVTTNVSSIYEKAVVTE